MQLDPTLDAPDARAVSPSVRRPFARPEP